MDNLYRLRFLPFLLGCLTLLFALIYRIARPTVDSDSILAYGLIITFIGIAFWRGMALSKKEKLHDKLVTIAQKSNQLLKEISLSEFDPEEIPIIRVFSNGTSSLIFEMFPPENNKFTSEQIDKMHIILAEIAGVEVLHDDRESFLILSNNETVLNKIASWIVNPS